MTAPEGREPVCPAENPRVEHDAFGAALRGGDDRGGGGPRVTDAGASVEPAIGAGQDSVLARGGGVDRPQRDLHDAQAARSELELHDLGGSRFVGVVPLPGARLSRATATRRSIARFAPA